MNQTFVWLKAHAYLLLSFTLAIMPLYVCSESVVPKAIEEEQDEVVTFIRLKKNNLIEDIELDVLSTEGETFNIVAKTIASMPMQHKATSYEHALSLMSKRANICIRNIVKSPERERLFVFSEPQTIFLGARLYISDQQVFEQISALEEITLASIAANFPRLTLGIEESRSYGITLDKAINDWPEQNKYIVKRSDNEAMMIMMLAKNRIQLLLEYPTVFKLDSEQLFPEKYFNSVELTDIAPFVFGRIACSKTTDGQEIVNRINKAFPDVYFRKDYLEAHLKWLDKGSRQTFNALYKKHFLNHSPMSEKEIK